MARNQAVLVQIESVDALLKRTGVSSFCMDCIRGPEGGCCQGCSSLGPDGCTDKPLACALWLCRKASKQFPEVSKELDKVNGQWPWLVANGFRHFSLYAEECLNEGTNPLASFEV